MFLYLIPFYKPVLRRFLTRLIAIIPSMVVAIAVGRSGIDSLLVISQVILSIVLPFITLPLIWLTSSKKIMGVRARSNPGVDAMMNHDESADELVVDFSNSYFVTMVGVGIWLLVLAANVYVILSLIIGQ